MSSPGEVTLEWWEEPGSIPAPLSIVWCNFPEIESLGRPGPKSRPALVFKVRYLTAPPCSRFVVLAAFGTSVTKVVERPFDFQIGNAMLLNMLRLPQATRFDLDRVLWLPWAKPFFCPREENRYATPVMSVLPVEQRGLLQYTMMDRERRGMNGAYHNAPMPVVSPEGDAP
jgi:hypothetical protein